MAIQNKQEDPYVQLARSTIEEYVQTGRTIRVPQNLPKEMYQDRAGVFVSIKIKGKNRGESKSACFAAVSGRSSPCRIRLQKRLFKMQSARR